MADTFNIESGNPFADFNPLQEYSETSAWRTGKRDSLAPMVDAQIGYMAQMETNKANAALAQQQNDFNLMMWNKQNEYNSPKATMQRLVEAGINPRAYQQIGQFANASQPHKAERPEYDSPLGKLAKFSEQAQIDLAYKQLNLDRIKLTTDTLNATADRIDAYRSLNETKRHNKAMEGIYQEKNDEVYRHNYANEQISSNNLALKNKQFVVELEKQGIDVKYDKAGHFTIDVPDWIKTANKEEKLEYVKILKHKFENLKQDHEYKEGLNDWYDANQVLGAIATLLGLVLKR